MKIKFTEKIKRTPLNEFERDIRQENGLIEGGWLRRGQFALVTSTTGAGKSVLCTQMAISWTLGAACCGLRPIRPLKVWVIQSEDDEDRVARDRDDISASLFRNVGDYKMWGCWEAVQFVDFNGKMGLEFLATLDRELGVDGPDVVLISPLNAYFGGNLKEGSDATLFLKGGKRGDKEYKGFERILKERGCAAVLFCHTGKPPSTSEQKAWLNDSFSAYKFCGASEFVDAARSALTFLPCRNAKGKFIFDACKNGSGLGWTDGKGEVTTKSIWSWGDGGKHYWAEVAKSEWEGIFAAEMKRMI